ncbi:MAG: phosphopantetheine-protein transferase [Acidobacteria bacterium]|nr:MAG: phosphopantetheine-protein transferase [Acidobacteriota bacterium]
MLVCEVHDVVIKMLNCPALSSREFCQPRTLSNDEVQVWTLSHTMEQNMLRDLKRLLSGDELERAARFRFQQDHDRFVASRSILRSLLAGYLATDPSSLRFRYAEKGKPDLPSSPELQFNVAHSGEIILWAFARERRVGIDVEEIRTDFSTQEIAERFFSPAERQALCSLAASRRHQAFFHCWTRKEAFVKATGDGLSLPLDQFDVALASGQPAYLIATRPDAEESRRWSMHNLDVHPNYAAALVIERPVASER